MLELGGVVVCYATGPLIIERWLSSVPRYGVAAASLIVGALMFAPVAGPNLPDLARHVTLRPLLAALALAVVCTALAFVLFFALIAEVGGVRATVITFVNPAVAVVLGAVVLGEDVTVLTGVAFALILAGSVLATRRRAPDPEPAPEPVAAA
jgi:drug/metabolite transporter (DMT)-like permease